MIRQGRNGRALLGLAASGFLFLGEPGSAQQSMPSASGKLSGRAAIDVLIGSTMTGTSDGAPYFAFYAKDGTVTMKRGNEVSSGKWSVDGDDLCEEYPEDEDETCYKLELDGLSGIMTDEDGTPYKIDILPGNPQKL